MRNVKYRKMKVLLTLVNMMIMFQRESRTDFSEVSVSIYIHFSFLHVQGDICSYAILSNICFLRYCDTYLMVIYDQCMQIVTVSMGSFIRKERTNWLIDSIQGQNYALIWRWGKVKDLGYSTSLL